MNHRTHLRKLKLSLVLPAAQVTITAILTLWADRVDWMVLGGGHRALGPHVHLHLTIIALRRVWSGINAPTFPFCFAHGTPVPMLRTSIGEILYLVAVALLWYSIGSFVDQSRSVGAARSEKAKKSKTAFPLLVVGWGTLLLLWNAGTIGDAFPPLFLGGRLFRPDEVIVRTLFLLWSVILIVFPGLKLARDFRRKSLR